MIIGCFPRVLFFLDRIGTVAALRVLLEWTRTFHRSNYCTSYRASALTEPGEGDDGWRIAMDVDHRVKKSDHSPEEYKRVLSSRSGGSRDGL